MGEMINVLLPPNDGGERLAGQLDADTLEKRTGVHDDDNETTTWTEYWLDGLLVHRSAHVTLKKPLTVFGEAGGF